MLTLPNILTLSRIAAIPVIVALFWIDHETARWAALVVYILAGVTDYLDGLAARSLGSISSLGRFLDPIADKLLVAAVLLMLVAKDQIAGLALLPALVILCREILVSGLREFLAELNVGLPVSRLAKWKTVIQLVTLGFLIVGDAALPLIDAGTIGEVGLWIAAALTIITGYDYFRAGMRHLNQSPPTQPPGKPHDTPAPGTGARRTARRTG